MPVFGLFGVGPGNGQAPHPVAMNLYEMAASEELGRAAKIAERWRYYHGQHPRPLRIRGGQPDDNVVLNFVRIIVDVGVSALFGQDVRFELVREGEEDLGIEGEREREAERWLNACWRFNRKPLFLHNLALTGAIAGHAFVKILPAHPTQPYPRLVVLDPATVTVRWLPDDVATVVAYRIQYPALDPVTGKAIVVRQRIERFEGGNGWRITDERSEVGSNQWQVTSNTVWPWSWPPVIDCQNLPCPNQYWGISDVEDDIITLNNSINFILSNMQRIVRYHAHPKTWGRGFTANQLNVSVDDTIVLPSPEAELRNLEMQSDLASSIALYQRQREALHEIARIPEVATGKIEHVGQLSGVALQILYRPLVEKTETKRRLYGDLLIELNRRLLALGGFGDGMVTELHWPELVPSDIQGAAQTAVLWQQVGVSQDTILQRLGFDPDLERQKREVSSAQFGEQLLTAFERGQS